MGRRQVEFIALELRDFRCFAFLTALGGRFSLGCWVESRAAYVQPAAARGDGSGTVSPSACRYRT
jgi:hypothetical protein